MVFINDIIGNFGKYQLWICFIIFINKLGVAFHHMAIIFLAPPTKYRCSDTNITCCDKPVYDTSVFTRTIVTEWNLICNKSWLKDFTQTLFQLGVLIGSLIFGIASDKYGRKLMLIISVIVEVLAGIMASFVPEFWIFTIIRMILGFSVGGVMVVGFVIVMEYVGNVNRDVISAFYHLPFTIGHVALAMFGYFIRDYTYFQLAISLTNCILLFYICLLPETPRWLLATNKTTQAIQLMQKVAKINKMPIDADDIQRKVDLYQIEHRVREKTGTVIDLFRTPNLRKNIIIMSLNWLVCSYCFYGVSQYISHLSGNIFLNVVASGAVCLFAVLFSIPLMKFFGRRTVVISCNLACSVCLLIIAVIPEGLPSVVLGCIGVLFSFIVFIVVYLFCSEMFPTVVRNAAIGICSMMARLGAMLAPFVAGLVSLGRWCAPVAFGIPPLFAAALCFFLPETKDCELLSTIEEGEAFGRKPRPVVTSEET